MKRLLLITLLLFSRLVSAQETGFMPGFIVTLENDTIPGYVKNKNTVPYRILQDIKFRKDEKSEVQIFQPKDLVGFQTGKNRYVALEYAVSPWYDASIKLPRRSFWEILIEGELNLYELRITQFGVSNELIFKALKKRAENDLFSIYGSEFKARILKFLEDEPALCDRVKAGYYGRNNIASLVEYYNVLKYAPDVSKNKNAKGTVIFYRVPGSVVHYLVVDDSTEFRIPAKTVLATSVPIKAQTKICFGSNVKKSCALIPAATAKEFPMYYELNVGSGGTNFYIERKEVEVAQRDIAEMKSNR